MRYENLLNSLIVAIHTQHCYIISYHRARRRRHVSRRTMSVMSDREIIQLEEKKLHDQKLTEEELAIQGSVSWEWVRGWFNGL